MELRERTNSSNALAVENRKKTTFQEILLIHANAVLYEKGQFHSRETAFSRISTVKKTSQTSHPAVSATQTGMKHNCILNYNCSAYT